jgi:hypothetical protein
MNHNNIMVFVATDVNFKAAIQYKLHGDADS